MSHMEMWMPTWSLSFPERKWNEICSNWSDANHPATYAPAA